MSDRCTWRALWCLLAFGGVSFNKTWSCSSSSWFIPTLLDSVDRPVRALSRPVRRPASLLLFVVSRYFDFFWFYPAIAGLFLILIAFIEWSCTILFTIIRSHYPVRPVVLIWLHSSFLYIQRFQIPVIDPNLAMICIIYIYPVIMLRIMRCAFRLIWYFSLCDYCLFCLFSHYLCSRLWLA